MAHSSDVTALLHSLGEGNEAAVDDLFAILYDELRRVARRQMARSGDHSTMTPTVVVHEVYLKFLAADSLSPKDQAHFLTLVAKAMRQVLVDHARAHQARKRGGGARRTMLDDSQLRVEEDASTILELDSALTRLEGVDDRLARLVSLRFFAGLQAEEAAKVLGITPRTLRRDWRKARAILYADLYDNEPR